MQTKKLLMMLVALFTMATGAWAQTPTTSELTPNTDKTVWTLASMPAFNMELQVEYEPEFTATLKALNSFTDQQGKPTVKVTEKDGTTEYTGASLDADNKLSPLYEGQNVTLTAATGNKFKSVTAVPTGAANGAINAKFSISATKQVYFSKGNLQLVGKNTWQFAEHQYDYFGGNQSDNHRDLFGWGTGDNPNLTSTTPSDYATFTDWGTNMGAGWRTLTADEWTYLFTGRSVTTRYCKATVNGVGGVVLFPDTYTHPAGVTAPQNINPPATSTADGGTSFAANVWSLADWEKMEAAGCVLLPAAGWRNGATTEQLGVAGYYWSSSIDGSDATKAQDVVYNTDGRMWIHTSHVCQNGFSVRLVYDPNEPIEVSLNTDKTEAKFAMPAGNVEVQIEYEPKFTATFNAANANTIGTEATVKLDDVAIDTLSAEKNKLNGIFEGQNITLTAAAGYKIKSVTAVPTDGINGKFSISDSKQVCFSKGNLQATYDGSTWSWDFAKNQWDYIGTGNEKVNGNASVSSNCTIDLFKRSTSSNYFGIHNSMDDNVFSGDFVDWGTAIGSGWRTLTHDEWNFLLQSRTTTSGLLFAKANLFGTVHGLILFPDNYTHPDGLAAITAPNDATGSAGWNGNQYTAEEWAKMEAAGAVFLPAAGCREGSESIRNINTIGYYHTATPFDANNNYEMPFHASTVEAKYYQPNHWAFSVRLVNGLEVTLNDDKTEAKFAMPGNDVALNYELVRDMAVSVGASIKDAQGGSNFRIQQKDGESGYEPYGMTWDEMKALIVVRDTIGEKNLTIGTDCTVAIYAVDSDDQPTGDAITDFASLTPGRYVAIATAIEGTNYVNATLPDNIFELFVGIEIKDVFAEECAWATYVSTQAVKIPDGIAAYRVSSVTETTVTAETIDHIPADVPVLLKRSNLEVNDYIAAIYMGESGVESLLSGSATATSTPTAYKDFVLYKDEFVLAGAAVSVAAGHAYLPAAVAPVGANTRGITEGGDGTTGIDGISNDDSQADGDWYDLNGRKLGSKPKAKGVYILGGKKIIIK